MSIRWRIGLSLAAVALAVAVAAAVVAYLSTSSQVASGVDQSLRASAIAANSNGSGGPVHHEGNGSGNIDNHDVSNPGPGGCGDNAALQPASAAQVVAPTGSVTACLTGGPTLPITQAERILPSGTDELRTIVLGSTRYRLLSTPWHDGGTLQIARSLTESDAILHRLRYQLGAMVLAATLVAAAIGWIIATRLARPIRRLRSLTHRIATTLDLSTPVEVKGPGEVGDLAASFSTMVAAVATSHEQQQRLVADASHEMRTPLTSLRSNLELLRAIEALPPAERTEVVADVLEDVDELSSLLEELVVLASDLTADEPSETVLLGDLARTVASRAQRRSQREVRVDADDSATVLGRPRQLERAINNLVDNAVKYSPAGSPIEVEVAGSRVTVLDRGPGVPEEDLERIFDRFYRAVDMRAMLGSGLGLAIVLEIVRSHGGRVTAANRPGGGASIGFHLPATHAGQGHRVP